MKTILELIESWKPCPVYKAYLTKGHLNAGMTIDDILYSKDIDNRDKDWFFHKLFNGRLQVATYPSKVEVLNECRWQYYWKVHTYSYTTFLAIVDEYLEYANIDAAI